MPTVHGITLAWTAAVPGSDPAVSYNVYRGTVTGGPYTKLNMAPVTGTTFTDSTGTAGIKYFYVTTSVDAQGNESAFSNEASAVALGNPNPPTALTATAS